MSGKGIKPGPSSTFAQRKSWHAAMELKVRTFKWLIKGGLNPQRRDISYQQIKYCSQHLLQYIILILHTLYIFQISRSLYIQKLVIITLHTQYILHLLKNFINTLAGTLSLAGILWGNPKLTESEYIIPFEFLQGIFCVLYHLLYSYEIFKKWPDKF